MKIRKFGIYLFVLYFSIPAVSSAVIRNVKDYGATGNGVTNDGPAIKTAIDALQPGDQLYFPSGTYLYDNSSTWYTKVENKSNITIFGDGKEISKLKASNSAKSAFRILYCSNVTVEDLQVTSPSNQRLDDNHNSAGFFIRGGNTIEFHSVKVYRVRAGGIFFMGVNGGGVWDSEVRLTGADGIHLTTDDPVVCSSITIQNNHAYNTGDDSFTSCGYHGYRNNSITIKNNYTQDSYCCGVTVSGSENVEVRDNFVLRSGASGIRVESDAYWQSSGCNEVTVWYNTVVEAPQRGDCYAHPSILIMAAYQDISNVHIRYNQVINPVSDYAFLAYGTNGRYVRNSQIQSNAISEEIEHILKCVKVEGTTQNVSVAYNTYNGVNCAKIGL